MYTYDNPNNPDNRVSELASLMNIYIHSYYNPNNLSLSVFISRWMAQSVAIGH